MDQPGKVANPARGQLNRENDTGREWDGNNLYCGGTGTAGTETSNGRGRETSVGKGIIATVSVPVPFPYRPDHFSRPDFYRAKP